MDLGAAAHGIAIDHYGALLLCVLGVHLVALVLCWLDLVRPRAKHPPVSPYFALALVAGCHVWLLARGRWHAVILDGSLVWAAALVVAGGWVAICAWRTTTMRRSRTVQ